MIPMNFENVSISLKEVNRVIEDLTPYRQELFIFLTHEMFRVAILPAEDRHSIDIRDVIAETIDNFYSDISSGAAALSNWDWLYVLIKLLEKEEDSQ